MVIFPLSLSTSLSTPVFSFGFSSSIDLSEFHFSNEANEAAALFSIRTFNEPLVNRAMLHFTAPRLSIDLMRFLCVVSLFRVKWTRKFWRSFFEESMGRDYSLRQKFTGWWIRYQRYKRYRVRLLRNKYWIEQRYMLCNRWIFLKMFKLKICIGIQLISFVFEKFSNLIYSIYFSK